MDKIDFLAAPNWKPALAFALAGDAAGYVRAIKARNYFTAALDPYLRSVVSIAARVLPVAEGVADDIEPDDDATCRDRADCMQVELPDWLRARVEMFNKLGPSLDDYWTNRKFSHDSDPTMPGVKLPDSDPPGAA
jgi:hypothetical protein